VKAGLIFNQTEKAYRKADTIRSKRRRLEKIPNPIRQVAVLSQKKPTRPRRRRNGY
jgi:hypothetical protein